MSTIKSSLFPFPYILNKQKYDGSLINWSKFCLKCKTEACILDSSSDLAICSYGFNFYKVEPSLIIAGIVIKEFQTHTQARKKRLKDSKENIINKECFFKSIDSLSKKIHTIDDEYSKKKDRILHQYAKKELYKIEFLSSLKEDIQKGLSFVHDYKQINTQISQNINLILETKYSGDNIDDKLKYASDPEKAIYFSSKYLEEKLNVAKYLMNPQWINDKSEFATVSFYGLVLKYRRIYRQKFDQKDINVVVYGKSYNTITANPRVISVIPHTFIDNAN